MCLEAAILFGEGNSPRIDSVIVAYSRIYITLLKLEFLMHYNTPLRLPVVIIMFYTYSRILSKSIYFYAISFQFPGSLSWWLSGEFYMHQGGSGTFHLCVILTINF